MFKRQLSFQLLLVPRTETLTVLDVADITVAQWTVFVCRFQGFFFYFQTLLLNSYSLLLNAHSLFFHFHQFFGAVLLLIICKAFSDILFYVRFLVMPSSACRGVFLYYWFWKCFTYKIKLLIFFVNSMLKDLFQLFLYLRNIKEMKTF